MLDAHPALFVSPHPPRTQLRKPEEVMKLALPYLQTGSLHSEEDLAILEQLIIAAIDTGNLEVAESGVTKVRGRRVGGGGYVGR